MGDRGQFGRVVLKLLRAIVAFLKLVVLVFLFLVVGSQVSLATHNDVLAVGVAVASVVVVVMGLRVRRSIVKRRSAEAERKLDGRGWTPHSVPAQGSIVSTPRVPPGSHPDPWEAGAQRPFDVRDPAMPYIPMSGQPTRPSGSDSSQPSVSVDRVASEQRKARLESYLAANVLNSREGFICKTAGACRSSALKGGAAFYEAQGHMVGPCYDTQVGGKPYRVLVLPMETGEPKQHRTVEQRTKDVLSAGRTNFAQRNQHMRGVTFALRLAFGLPVDADTEHIQFADGTSAHLFDAYAMTNLLLCSAVDHGTAKSRATGIMRKSCSRHLRASLEVLQPTLVISQGAGLDNTLSSTLGVIRSVDANVAACDLAGSQFVWVSLRHPSRGNWSSLKCTYLHGVVVPAITKGRALALSGM